MKAIICGLFLLTVCARAALAYDAKLFEYPGIFQRVLYELDGVADQNRKKNAEDAINEMRFGEY